MKPRRRGEATLLFLSSPEAVAAVKKQLGLEQAPEFGSDEPV